MIFEPQFFSPWKVFIRKAERKLTRVIRLHPSKPNGKSALLSYVTHPFCLQSYELRRAPHTNPWETLVIAKLLLNRGFDVDVIDWTNTSFLPKRDYAVVLDVHQNLERLAPVLRADCVKIFYSTGAHWLTQNLSELQRLNELIERRGIVLRPRRQVVPAHNVAYADAITCLGNAFSKETFAFAKRDITQIPLLSIVSFDSPEDKDFHAVRRNFVYIGGGGGVHKGLDRVLECFAAMPEFNLTVCAPIEEDFKTAYSKELAETPNITAVGRIDIRGGQFKEIIRNAVGLVYPTCSEGQAGSVITGLHAGLIPIVTRQSGVDVDGFGVTLNDASIDEIRNAVTAVSSLSEDELRTRSKNAWAYARENHTIEKYTELYAKFLDAALKNLV